MIHQVELRADRVARPIRAGSLLEFLAVRLVPPDLMAEFRAKAERREGRPTSRIGAALIVTLWIDSAVFLLWWFWPTLAG